MNDKILVDRELLERILTKMNIVWQQTDEMVELRAALAAPVQQQEPVAWVEWTGNVCDVNWFPSVLERCPHLTKLYAHPAPADALVEAITNAINWANGRESEWGERAETAFGFLHAALAAAKGVKP